jgi:hypothetical protein
LARPIVSTYEEACHIVEDLGILPLSSFMPGHPSLDSMTLPLHGTREPTPHRISSFKLI